MEQEVFYAKKMKKLGDLRMKGNIMAITKKDAMRWCLKMRQ